MESNRARGRYVGKRLYIEEPEPPPPVVEEPKLKPKLTLANRRSMIAFLFQFVYGYPPEEDWHAVITDISDYLDIPAGSRDSVKKVLTDVKLAVEAGVEYDPNKGVSSRKKGTSYLQLIFIF